MTLPIHTCRQFRLLIIGSSKTTPDMLRVAREAVQRAKTNGWQILVGDAPQGIQATIVSTCAALNVNIMVFGTGEHPRNRSTPRDLYWQVDVPADQDDEDYNLAKAQAVRDEYMIRLCDRLFLLSDGESPEIKRAYDYAGKLGKAADLRVIKNTPPSDSAPQREQQPPKTAAPVLHTVEIIVDASDPVELGKFTGQFGLRALNSTGTLLYDLRGEIVADVHTSDGARMHTLAGALERLTTRLKSECATYHIRIYQCSKNIDGWMARGWKRNVPEVQRLTTALDELLVRFPKVEWVKESRTSVNARLGSISSNAKR
jgi:hypothetical protein